jgi:hypothetical protein
MGGAESLGVKLSIDLAHSLLRFLARFYDWNRFGGFTRILRKDAIRLHLLDSLSVVADLMGLDRSSISEPGDARDSWRL